MGREIINFIMVLLSAITALCYCHYIAKLIPIGTKRLIAILPVVVLFFLLPLIFTTYCFIGFTSFSLTWLASFKLILFAFGQPPLSSSLPLSQFIPLASLPIKFKHTSRDSNTRILMCSTTVFSKSTSRKTLEHKISKNLHNYASKAIIISTFGPIYMNKEKLNEKFVMAVYAVHIYATLEIVLGITRDLAQATLGIELEPTFDKPYLSSSVQNFWGKRWNLMAGNILRITVYSPVRLISGRWMSRRLSLLVAFISTFLVSGLMHELILYYLGRKKTTWELTYFFLLQGVCLFVEVEVKKMVNGKWKIPEAVSRLLAVGFVSVTGIWLFLPSFMRIEADVVARKEFDAFIQCVCGVFHVLSCIFFKLVQIVC